MSEKNEIEKFIEDSHKAHVRPGNTSMRDDHEAWMRRRLRKLVRLAYNGKCSYDMAGSEKWFKERFGCKP